MVVTLLALPQTLPYYALHYAPIFYAIIFCNIFLLSCIAYVDEKHTLLQLKKANAFLAAADQFGCSSSTIT